MRDWLRWTILAIVFQAIAAWFVLRWSYDLIFGDRVKQRDRKKIEADL